MSLYDDIGLDRKDLADQNSDVAGWSVGHKLLQSYAKTKKTGSAAPSSSSSTSSSYSKKRGSSSLAPVVDLARTSGRDPAYVSKDASFGQADGEIRFNHITGKMESGPPPKSFAQFGVATYPTNSPFAGMSQEYDPLFPNEYSDFAKRIKEQRNFEREEERRREDEERRSGSVASKIMAKMGYKHGSGLGREEQGMSMALQVEKTSRRGGKILHEKDIATKEAALNPGQPVKADTGITNTELLRNPSKVLLLMNMVGAGEVDSELEPETAEECSKYGKVIKCVIYEVPNAPEIEAVRIFVEFEKISFAIKAAIDLNGRYFGGRVVRAAFYSHEKFLNMQLGDPPM